jgi:phosphoheptose isomerase
VGDSGNLSAEDVEAYFAESAAVLTETAGACRHSILEVASMLVGAIRAGDKIMVCGNGGSAADAQHFAAELVGRFDKNVERAALPALALTTDTSFLTAYANDYDFSGVFARQIEALGQPGDVLVLISTSGNSPNLLAAAEAATQRGILTVGFLGGSGGRLRRLVDCCVVVPSENTQHIQEGQTAVMHFVASFVETSLFATNLMSSSRAEKDAAFSDREPDLWNDVRGRLRHNTGRHGHFRAG